MDILSEVLRIVQLIFSNDFVPKLQVVASKEVQFKMKILKDAISHCFIALKCY